MDFLRHLIEMLHVHCISHMHSGCCDTTVEVNFDEDEQQRRRPSVEQAVQQEPREPGFIYPDRY